MNNETLFTKFREAYPHICIDENTFDLVYDRYTPYAHDEEVLFNLISDYVVSQGIYEIEL
ncbi:MAG: hypothetical protein RSE41_00340 [Clostridia bacterium]